MRRFSLWLRGKPVVADSILAAALFVLEVISSFQSNVPWLFLVVGLALCTPIPFRRSYPRIVAAVLLALSMTSTIISWAVDFTLAGHPALLGLAIALYTLVAYVGRRQAAVYVVALVADSVLSISLLRQGIIESAGIAGLIFALAWITAEFLGARRAYDEEVAARLAVADYDRERSAHEAVAAERTRIARELHDVVAHAVSVMIVQADGASYAMRTDPATAEKALSNIAGTGRQALGELRRTVALLRVEQAPEELPQHGTAGVARVVDMMRKAGLHVELEQTGQLDDVAPPVSLGVHRIVQESLTNVLRHGGPNPKAWVRVERHDRDVTVVVTDNGSGGPEFTHPGFGDGSGHGLVGMRERVAVLRGTLDAGRRADGGWRVRARLPLQFDD
ncbi:sensor histidine kinase [Antrihabitans cavernicola]|uniref:histidine kinase n=1 Tax=Antrihabitans cavernicola TaxID=2495913 RepID=A0A5A7S8S2_9NOCA|nr:histidine kinase [Spelaeibacter cavernicola]KAA0021317.1 sensor histidine kinase [Spelaeibacter cavernicola]